MMEKIAEMMIRCSLATGHGDTVEDLLAELEEQIKELQKDRRLDGAEIVRLRDVTERRFEEGLKFQERAEKAEATRDLQRKELCGAYEKVSELSDRLISVNGERHKLARAICGRDRELAQARKALEDYRSEHSYVHGFNNGWDEAKAELAQARKALEDIVNFYDGPTEAKRPDFFERLMNRARAALITGTEGEQK